MYSSTWEWVAEELSSLDLGDKRRNERAKRMVRSFADRPGGSIPPMCENQAEVKATYRLLSNEAVDPQGIRDALQNACLGRLDGLDVVLVPQDTMFLDFTSHPKTTGLGPTGGGDGSAGHGMIVHSATAISGDGIPLGLLHQQVWARDPDTVGGKRNRKRRPLEDKESYRWLQTARAVEAAVPEHIQLVQIADREGDIFELFAEPRRANSHLLIRSKHDRRVQGPHGSLRAEVRAAPLARKFEMLVRQSPNHTTRKANLELRFCPVTIKPPDTGVHEPSLSPVALSAVLITEPDPPEGVKRIEWLLLTDLPVGDTPQALRCLRYYGLRWLIERYHFVLKSGCGIERSQLRSAAALERLLALFSVVALRLLWITYASRAHGDEPCTIAFGDVEWQVLYRQAEPMKPLPEAPPSLRDAVWWTASLGGFMGRKGDGEPGVKVLWRGLMRLQDIVIGFLLASGEDVGKA